MGAIALLALAGVAQAMTPYWDANGVVNNGPGDSFGLPSDIKTWGGDALWTTDASGSFADGGTLATTAADVPYVNQSDPTNNAWGAFTMNVSGDVSANRVVSNYGNSGRTVTINDAGGGVLHLYGVGSTEPLFGTTNDFRPTVNVPIVLEQPGGSAVYLGSGGGNNSNFIFNGDITSTNTVDLFFDRAGHGTMAGELDLAGGSFTSLQRYSFQPRILTISGMVGSGVEDITMNAGKGNANGVIQATATMVLANASNSFTGDTSVLSGVLQINGPFLPDARDVYLTSIGTVTSTRHAGLDTSLVLNFAGTDTIAKLFIDGVAQAAGTWGASGNGLSDHETTLISGAGLLNVTGGAVAAVSPVITSITVTGATATITMKGAADTTYVCKSSLDLGGFAPVATIPDPLTTDGSGSATFTVDAAEAMRFYLVEP